MSKRNPDADRLIARAFRGPVDEVWRGVSRSLLSAGRLGALAECLKATAGVPGDTAEIGIAAGGTTRLIALWNPDRRHWACDTFTGLADVGAADSGLKNGMFARPETAIDTVRADLRGLRNVRLVRGMFPASAPRPMLTARYAFAHVDVDTYASVRASYEFFAERMAPGGILALDDVLLGQCHGAIKAWSEIERAGGSWRVHSRTAQQVALLFR